MQDKITKRQLDELLEKTRQCIDEWENTGEPPEKMPDIDPKFGMDVYARTLINNITYYGVRINLSDRQIEKALKMCGLIERRTAWKPKQSK